MQTMQKTAKMSSCEYFRLLSEIVLETKAHKSLIIETETTGQHSVLQLTAPEVFCSICPPSLALKDIAICL